jgi:O-antigen/teichoic acid export membrane protein
MIFLTYGLETGFFRFSQNNDDKPNVYTTIMSSLFTSSSIFIALVFIFLEPLSRALGYVGFEKYIWWMALIIGIDAFTSVPLQSCVARTTSHLT